MLGRLLQAVGQSFTFSVWSGCGPFIHSGSKWHCTKLEVELGSKASSREN